MARRSKTPVIAIEEHYLDSQVDQKLGGRGGGGGAEIKRRLSDLGELRVREMDEAGIDIQVLSHCPPGAQVFDGPGASEAARAVNDRLHQVVKANPARFAAFASLATRDPAGSAQELDRCVSKLGFKGAMIHGLTDGLFIDDKRFWPIFERAQALDVPIYVHPSMPSTTVVQAYYKDYVEKYPAIVAAGWGFTVETATAGVRLVLSGVFDAYPKLKIILGHMGEGLPFLLWRINHAFAHMGRPDVEPIGFRDVFCEHFYITTSGNFSHSALLCSIMEMGADRILFSVDWPYIENAPGTRWLDGAPIGREDRDKILSGNAKRLLRM
jgi:2,3-dihydroxybenzoate decarboxylase